jgi:hypothetical protein
MNWFRSKGMSSGAVEGFNNKVKLTMRKRYGFELSIRQKSFYIIHLENDPNQIVPANSGEEAKLCYCKR